MKIKKTKHFFKSLGKKFSGVTLYNNFISRDSDYESLSNLIKNTKDKSIFENMNIDLNSLKYIEQGEKDFLNTLKKSEIPMLILHDICLSYQNKPVKIDFVVLTKYFIGVYETKKLNGDICINQDGSFSRFIRDEDGIPIKEEGLYSPYIQNQRNSFLLEKILKENGILTNPKIVAKVIAANPKTIVDDNYGDKEVISNILRLDEFDANLNYIVKKAKKAYNYSTIVEIADFLVNNSELMNSYIVEKYKR
ncbi:MAG: nuclease-related domain-containing protein [Acidaminobacteraceae bacterium]